MNEQVVKRIDRRIIPERMNEGLSFLTTLYLLCSRVKILAYRRGEGIEEEMYNIESFYSKPPLRSLPLY